MSMRRRRARARARAGRPRWINVNERSYAAVTSARLRARAGQL